MSGLLKRLSIFVCHHSISCPELYFFISILNMMEKKSTPELLAPAGSPEKLKAALRFGADAVYLGAADFSLRVRVNDFNIPRIRQAVSYARTRGKKVYVTVNIFAHNRHFSSLPGYIKKLREIGVDALIVSDPGVITLIQELWPQAEIHLSTQANCLNWRSASFWQKNGVKRIILGREINLVDISKIKRKLPGLELEYFVHGSMCMAYSGRCFLSQYFLNRSANLGDCVQPCRWPYQVKQAELWDEEKQRSLRIEEDSSGSYILNAQDLCLIEYLRDLKKAGVDSFKIEGRNKSVYYLSMVTGAYRQALEEIESSKEDVSDKLSFLKQELEEKLFHRGYGTGFLLGEVAEQTSDTSTCQSGWEFCGQVLRKARSSRENKGKYLLKVKVHNSIRVGDVVEIVKPFYNVDRVKIEKMWNSENGEEIIEAHGGGSRIRVLLGVDNFVEEGSVLRRIIKT